MRTIPIPVDTTKLTFVCVSAPRPRLVDKDTGEVKVDKQGRTVFQVGLSVSENDSGRVELINVNVSGDPDLNVGQVVQPHGLIGFAWQQTRGGETRWGISYRAASFTASDLPAAA
ncbi:SCO3933 family regulatory protein [Actinoallomurus acaciae]|uniref:Regulatory protein n=1 Tax=Actinoallomurus acaciae TaxID=502577 RepID=A0ABV5YGS6_9ACTN